MLYAEPVDQVETRCLRQKGQSVYFESVGIEKKSSCRQSTCIINVRHFLVIHWWQIHRQSWVCGCQSVWAIRKCFLLWWFLNVLVALLRIVPWTEREETGQFRGISVTQRERVTTFSRFNVFRGQKHLLKMVKFKNHAIK